MKISIRVLAAFFLLLVITGCSSRLADFTIASTKNIDFSQAYTVEHNNRVQGDDIVSIVVIMPIGMSTVGQAMDNAIQKTPNCIALTDVTVSVYMWYIPLIYGKTGYVVEGTPVCIDTAKTK